MFSDGGIGLSDSWRRINVVLVLPARNGPGRFRPWPGTFTPFVHISHTLKTFCTLRTPGVIPETRPITFTTAVKFASHPDTMPSSGTTNPPPFLQLYDESGEPRVPDPLPVYAKKDPMRKAVYALLMPSENVMSRESSESSNENLPIGTPPSPELMSGSDIVLPTSMSLPDGAVTALADEEYPKPTLGRASGSRTVHLALHNLSEQV